MIATDLRLCWPKVLTNIASDSHRCKHTCTSMYVGVLKFVGLYAGRGRPQIVVRTSFVGRTLLQVLKYLERSTRLKIEKSVKNDII